jgi:uncharacterized membrane protein YkvI
LSEESTKIVADMKRLEERIDNLRFAVICLTILVALLCFDAIFQSTPLGSLLPLFGAVGIIILCLFLLANSCQKTMALSPKPESQSSADSSK